MNNRYAKNKAKLRKGEYQRGNNTFEYRWTDKHGKRQCDTNTSGYNAIVILYKGQYDRLFRLFRNRFGEYKMMTAAPLCGECTWKVTLDNMFSELENEIKEKCR